MYNNKSKKISRKKSTDDTTQRITPYHFSQTWVGKQDKESMWLRDGPSSIGRSGWRVTTKIVGY